MKPSRRSLAALLLLPAFLQAQTGAKVVNTFSVPGDGRWDYLTSGPDNKLYVSHGNQVNVIDKQTGQSLSVFNDLSGVHGIALDVHNGKGFISNGKENNVVVFDLKTESVITRVATGNNPDAIMYEPVSKTIVTGNGKSNSLSVIDPVTLKVKATVDIGGKPEAIVSDREGKLYVNLEDKAAIAVVDVNTFKVVRTIKLAPKGEDPAGLAIDVKHRLLFVGCGNQKLLVVQLSNDAVIAVLPIGEDCDGVAYNAHTQTIYASNADGTLNIIHQTGAAQFRAEKALTTQKGAKTLALDESTGRVYLSVAGFTKEKDAAGRAGVVPGTFKILVVR